MRSDLTPLAEEAAIAHSPHDPSWIQALTASWPFSSIPEDVVEKLASRMRECRFEPGETLIRQGDPGDSLMVVLEGTVEVSVLDRDMASRRVTEMGAGEVVGEMALVTGEPRSANVTAVAPVRALVLPREAFDALARATPILGLTLSEVVRRRLGEHAIDGLFSKTLDGYRLEQPLGRGGMSVVYRAEQIATGETRALKMMHHSLMYDSGACRRFHREEKVIRSLAHENIVRVHDIFPAYGTYFMALEFCEGVDLAEVLRRRGAIPEDQVRRVLGQLALALSHAHARGVIHRDLKPANVMLDRDGVVKLMDFGLAKPALAETLTRGNVILGTPAYMSPEQKAGETVGKRSDIYSFGVVAYELLSGSRFASNLKTAEHILESELGLGPSLDRLDASLSTELQLLVARCLEQKPENRTVDLREVGRWADRVDTAILFGDRGSSDRPVAGGPDSSTVFLGGPKREPVDGRSPEMTRLLVAASGGNREALDRLIPLVHDRLKRLAARHMRAERIDHTLQASALVNEAYLRLVDQDRVSWEDRQRFFAIAARMMRRILADHNRRAAKRGGGADKLPLLGDELAVGDGSPIDPIALDKALDELKDEDEQLARVVELRFFAGFTIEETARELEVDPRSVKRYWQKARGFLRRRLQDDSR